MKQEESSRTTELSHCKWIINEINSILTIAVRNKWKKREGKKEMFREGNAEYNGNSERLIEKKKRYWCGTQTNGIDVPKMYVEQTICKLEN